MSSHTTRIEHIPIYESEEYHNIREKSRNRVQRKSLIAAALEYEADHGTYTEAVESELTRESSRGSQDSASFQASLFSAFNKDEIEVENDGFDVNRPLNNISEKNVTIDMTKQCSMIHRMMEDGKTDVDPRDVHKLLPSVMLSSESLDLHSDNVQGKITQAICGMSDLDRLMDAQALQFEAEQKKRNSLDKRHLTSSINSKINAKKEFLQRIPKPNIPTPSTNTNTNTNINTNTSTTNTTSANTTSTSSSINSTSKQQQQQQQTVSTISMSLSNDENKKTTVDIQRMHVTPSTQQPTSVETTSTSVSTSPSPSTALRQYASQTHVKTNNGNQSSDPSSPVTGWPAAPVLGIMHPMNNVINVNTSNSDGNGTNEIIQVSSNCHGNNIASTPVQQPYALQSTAMSALTQQSTLYPNIHPNETTKHFYNASTQSMLTAVGVSNGSGNSGASLHWPYPQETIQMTQTGAQQIIPGHVNACNTMLTPTSHHAEVMQAHHIANPSLLNHNTVTTATTIHPHPHAHPHAHAHHLSHHQALHSHQIHHHPHQSSENVVDMKKMTSPVPCEEISYKSQDDVESDCSEEDEDNESMNSKDGKAKKFKSLEAALAWCHVQHSQKQVPVVPKDDVRKLVDFQLKSAKPIRAPWYRPQKEDIDQNNINMNMNMNMNMNVNMNMNMNMNVNMNMNMNMKEGEEGTMSVSSKEESIAAVTTTSNDDKHVNLSQQQNGMNKVSSMPMHSSVSTKVQNKMPTKVGTGFFCPPGSSMARI